MKIGIDLDNTIVCYDFIFRKVALEKGLIPSDLPEKAKAVKDHLFATVGVDVWTELQGVVYGPRMKDAIPFPYMLAVLRKARKRGDTIFIISHKTAKPVIGPPISLHKIALEWIEKNLQDNSTPLVPKSQVFLNETREKKIDIAESLDLDFFIDDLPDILQDISFPTRSKKILFDPHRKYLDNCDFTTIHSWDDLNDILF